MSKQWHGAEAWIFLSIGDAARLRPATLDEVLGWADVNNHAIPSADEFCLAVGQLVGAGLVNASHTAYGLADAGQQLYKAINGPPRDLITRFVDTADEWRLEAPVIAEPVAWNISEDDFRKAYEKYSRRFWKTYRKLIEGERKAR